MCGGLVGRVAKDIVIDIIRMDELYDASVLDRFDPIIRYRSRVSTNRVELGTPQEVDRFYLTVDAILEECLLVTHRWQGGDLMFVNNSWTLHDRLPFQGLRRMARVRFGDSVAQGLSY